MGWPPALRVGGAAGSGLRARGSTGRGPSSCGGSPDSVPEAARVSRLTATGVPVGSHGHWTGDRRARRPRAVALPGAAGAVHRLDHRTAGQRGGARRDGAARAGPHRLPRPGRLGRRRARPAGAGHRPGARRLAGPHLPPPLGVRHQPAAPPRRARGDARGHRYRPVVGRRRPRPARRPDRPGPDRRLHRPAPAARPGSAPAPGVRRRGHVLQPRRRRRARGRRRPGRCRLRRGGRRRDRRAPPPSPCSRSCGCRCHRPRAGRPRAWPARSAPACGCSPPCRRCARSPSRRPCPSPAWARCRWSSRCSPLEVGAPAAAGGALFSAFALGALAGSLVMASRQPRTGPLRMAFYGVAGLAAAFAAVAAAPTCRSPSPWSRSPARSRGRSLACTLAVRAAPHPPRTCRRRS